MERYLNLWALIFQVLGKIERKWIQILKEHKKFYWKMVSNAFEIILESARFSLNLQRGCKFKKFFALNGLFEIWGEACSMATLLTE